MTKKDYELIASVFNDELGNWGKGTESKAIYWVAKSLAEKLLNENERFNPVKFLKACGLPIDII